MADKDNQRGQDAPKTDNKTSGVLFTCLKFAEFLKGFEKLSEAEKKLCIEHTSKTAPIAIAELYNGLNEYMPE